MNETFLKYLNNSKNHINNLDKNTVIMLFFFNMNLTFILIILHYIFFPNIYLYYLFLKIKLMLIILLYHQKLYYYAIFDAIVNKNVNFFMVYGIYEKYIIFNL